MATQQPHAAIESFFKALSLDLRHAHTHYELGLAFNLLKMKVEAAECFRTALALGAGLPSGVVDLPSLALLGTPGILNLRRGAAQALDWLGRTTFSVFSLFVWLGWSAMVFGWPEGLAKRAVELEPGFEGSFSLPWTVLALGVTGFWVWLMATSQRSTYRSLAHWTAGLTSFWLLLAALWLPWLDYGNSYRGVTGTLVSRCILNSHYYCIFTFIRAVERSFTECNEQTSRWSTVIR